MSDPGRGRGAGCRAAGAALDQLYTLVETVPKRWCAFTLLKTFASLRWGEITALTPDDLDLELCTLRVRRQFLTVKGRAGDRSVEVEGWLRVVVPPGDIADTD